MAAQNAIFSSVPEAPKDAIFGVKARYKADPASSKINLGIGAYRTENGQPWVLPSVVLAEASMLDQEKAGSLNKEYLPITGSEPYIAASLALILGDDSPAIAEKRVGAVQALSGTGSLRILGNLIKSHFPGKKMYLPNPTWGNHKKIFDKRGAGLVLGSYRYFHKETRGLDFEGMLEDLSNAPNGQVVLLHACAHNPTGVDPTQEQWGQIAKVCEAKGHLALFDCAYQGFATGDLNADAYPVRMFVKRGMNILIAQSYSKNMGLYSERAGCASVVTSSPQQATAVKSQLAAIIRPMYSNPPRHGAGIVQTILTNKDLYTTWVQEIKTMSGRIIGVRQALYDSLKELGTPGKWDHILKQIGMFTFTGLTPAQMEHLVTKYHVYGLSNGRISMAGVTKSNAGYIAKAMDDAVRNV